MRDSPGSTDILATCSMYGPAGGKKEVVVWLLCVTCNEVEYGEKALKYIQAESLLGSTKLHCLEGANPEYFQKIFMGKSSA